MHKALEVLYHEHETIKSAIGYRKKINVLAKKNNPKFKIIVTELVGFFRKYADNFHHYKEEKILFPLLCEKNALLKDDSVVEEMLGNHDNFRDIVKSIESAAESGNYKESDELLNDYFDMLIDHISVEDDELFLMAENMLNESELEKLYNDFQKIDRKLGLDIKYDFENIKEKLEFELSSNQA